jgi:hypothetical protein
VPESRRRSLDALLLGMGGFVRYTRGPGPGEYEMKFQMRGGTVWRGRMTADWCGLREFAPA